MKKYLVEYMGVEYVSEQGQFSRFPYPVKREVTVDSFIEAANYGSSSYSGTSLFTRSPEFKVIEIKSGKEVTDEAIKELIKFKMFENKEKDLHEAEILEVKSKKLRKKHSQSAI